jgi:orotidine-5'-phosphate decarboxylase
VQARERIIVALDVPDRAAAEALLQKLTGRLVWVKIGLQLFTREGEEIVRLAQALGLRVFLDLKFHDIPHTVGRAIESVLGLGVSMTTLHTLGGPAMLREAGAAARGSDLTLLGVTLLTSMDHEQCHAVGLPTDLESQVLRLGELASSSNLGGLVCSPLEISLLRRHLPPALRIVTPGIRPAGSALGDQKRVMDPAGAIAAGSDWLVIGRPITHAADPALAFDEIVATLPETDRG